MDEALLNELKSMFLKGNQNKYNEIIKALDKDLKLAHRLVHNLKSNAGQIGKTGLQSAAADVERQLVGGINNTTERQLQLLKTELAIVLNELIAEN